MATLLRILVFASIGWVAVVMVLFGRRVRGDRLGSPPIHRFLFLLSKIGAGLPAVLLVWAAASGTSRLPMPAMVLVALLLIGGLLVFTLSLWTIGSNLRVGIPVEETQLVTSGVYRFSRNPIYVGLFMVLGASLLYAFSWLNLVAVVVGMVLHHQIILAEERFLLRSFNDYEAYRRRVRRYL
jgi:protein-S-isoprenylcysteine O-methyltransferase Ste14